MEFTREICLTWIASAGLNPEIISRLLRSGISPESLYAGFWKNGCFPLEDVIIQKNLAAVLKKNGTVEAMQIWAEKLSRHRIRVTTSQDENFPVRLQGIPDPPEILFYQGNLSALNRNTVAVVGSRNASRKGMEATLHITDELSRNGVGIVSGLAYGIDTAAHQGCLRGSSPTIAVMGCGLDMDYPAENAGLKQEILRKDGLILSEYVPGEKPLGWHFPWRNRIISALGDCLTVMEARIRSGSMTSVHHALDQGKDVFVYPGEPGSPRSEGNHQLLREGAIYFTCAEDLLEDMGWLDKTADVGQNMQHSSEDMQLSPMEQKLLQELDGGELSFEQLLEKMDVSASLLNATISMLQIQGLITALPGKRYERKAQ